MTPDWGHWMCMCESTNHSAWRKNETGAWGKDEEEHHDDGESWGKDKDDGHEGPDRSEEEHRCTCGSVAGHWEFIGKDGKEDWSKDEEGWNEDEEGWSKHESGWDKDKAGKKDSAGKGDKMIMVGLAAAGFLAGSVLVAVVCLIYWRKHVGAATPQAVGNCVIGQPANVVVGDPVEKGQAPKAQGCSVESTDLERGAAGPAVIV